MLGGGLLPGNVAGGRYGSGAAGFGDLDEGVICTLGLVGGVGLQCGFGVIRVRADGAGDNRGGITTAACAAFNSTLPAFVVVASGAPGGGGGIIGVGERAFGAINGGRSSASAAAAAAAGAAAAAAADCAAVSALAVASRGDGTDGALTLN